MLQCWHLSQTHRDRGATLRLGGRGMGEGEGTVSDSLYWKGGHKTPLLTNSL